MIPHVPEKAILILEILYYYPIARRRDLEILIGLKSSQTRQYLSELSKVGYVNRRTLSAIEYYALSDNGEDHIRKTIGYKDKTYSLDNNLWPEHPKFLEHQAWVPHVHARFLESGKRQGIQVYGKGQIDSYLEPKYRERRKKRRLLDNHIYPDPNNRNRLYKTDGVLILDTPKPILLFTEIDQGNKRHKHRKAGAQTRTSRDAFKSYIEAYRNNYFKRYYGDFEVYVLWLVRGKGGYAGEKRIENMKDHYQDVSKGRFFNWMLMKTQSSFDERARSNLEYSFDPLAGSYTNIADGSVSFLLAGKVKQRN